MALKKVVMILVVSVVVLTAGLAVVTKSQYNLYKEAPSVKYNQVLDDKETATIYYYYQDTCHFCQSIKDQVTDLYLSTENNPDINLVLVDVKSSTNAGAWADETYDYTQADLTDPEQIKIQGTPSMIYVEEGQVAEYESGPDVFTLMENVNQKFDLGLTFDPSRYGQA